MKNTNQIHELLSNASFLEWADSSFDISHPYTTSSHYTSLDSQTLQGAQVLYSSMTFAKKNLNLSIRSSILKNIHTSIENQEVSSPIPEKKLEKGAFNPIKWMGIAASLVALIAVVFLLNNTNNNIIDKKTGYGELVTIDLPDGSVANLDANSTLTMESDWSNRAERNLKLENSAYFNVTKNPKIGSAAFNVLTDAATVEVIGTEFSVDADGENLDVLVKSGQVKVTPSGTSDFETHILSAGDRLIIRNGIKVLADHLTTKQVDNQLAWMDSKIHFENTSFQTLETIVKDRFNKTLIVDDALLISSRAIDGTYQIMSVEDLLDPVAVAFDLQISYIGETIFLGYSKKD